MRQLDLNGMDAMTAYSIIRSEFDSQTFLLESVEGPKRTARYSFIGFEPLFDISSKGKELKYNGVVETVDDPYERLREMFYRFRTGTVVAQRTGQRPSVLRSPTARLDEHCSISGTVDMLPFSGGMVGYMSYDMVRFFEGLPDNNPDDLGLPDMHFVVPTYLVCYDHIQNKRYLISHGDEIDIETLLRKGSAGEESFTIGKRTNNMDRHEFVAAVEKAKQHIRQGDIFQTVLSRRTEVEYEGDELQIYRVLRDINPSPYMFFLDFDETKVIGSSPEMLMRLENNVLTTRPLAGTRARSNDCEEDEKLKLEMLLDDKERAEHVMLVDLHRNDMGRVSEYGSVKVTELMGVEKYSHVQHLVSNVVSKLSQDKDGFDALRACFPAGTVSGAPKIKAMEIIDDLEPNRRGPYAGVAGYFDFCGSCNFAINIRTIFTKNNKAYIQAGAGIVADSVPEKEFIETENKMGAMIRALEVGTYG